MRKVEVRPYDERWQSIFEEEVHNIHNILGAEIIEIHHIGSTAVNGLQAKPVIDIMPVVKEIGKVDEFNKAMTAIGYDPKGENGIAGRRYFQKGGDHRTHHIHFFEMESPEIQRHLAFRDYLRSHPQDAKKYGDLKEQLAMQFPFAIESYIKGKEQLAQEIENKAMEWYGRSKG